VEAAGIEPASGHYRNVVLARDFRSLALIGNELRGGRLCS
jgi:hypothetical protein